MTSARCTFAEMVRSIVSSCSQIREVHDAINDGLRFALLGLVCVEHGWKAGDG